MSEVHGSSPAPVSSETTLATLLHLIKRTRQADSLAALRFVLVNETQALVAYRQAAFWSQELGVEALSGVAEPERHAPYLAWLNRWCGQVRGKGRQLFVADLRVLPEAAETAWSEWLPPQLASIELPAQGAFGGGVLLLAREQPFLQAELLLLQEWRDAWVARYASLQPLRRFQVKAWRRQPTTRRRLIGAGVMLSVLILLALPVRLSVLAPAELIPLDPAVIRAPMDGIVDRVRVAPNDRVSAGAPLFEFDRVALASRLRVAEQSLATSEAEYRRNAQRAVFDAESKAELSVLQSQIAERRVEVDYLRELNQRSLVVAPRAGLVLFDDAADLLGKPVVTGEKIMIVADENQAQIEAWVSPADLVQFAPGSAVSLFLAADPVTPVTATISYVAHLAELRPDGLYAYRVRAQLDRPAGQTEATESALARVGLKGTARLEGERVALVYWVLRRPWAGLRGWIGL